MSGGAASGRRGVRASGDAGLTLIEVVVTMAIMSVVMIIFTTGIIQMYRSANKSESISLAHTQVSLVFQRLDKELRYADGIGEEYVAADKNYYIEYRYFDYLTGSTATQRCAQLRVNLSTRELQRRSWLVGGAVPPILTAGTWSRLASDVNTAVQPFTLLDIGSDGGIGFQRLRVNLVVVVGSNAQKTTTSTDVTFTALNTTRATRSAEVCPEGTVA